MQAGTCDRLKNGWLCLWGSIPPQLQLTKEKKD